MRVFPVKNSVICKKIASAGISDADGVLIGDQSPDMYEVISFSPGEGFEFSVGDVVLVDGIGDEFETSPGNSLFRFNVEKVMCKVLSTTSSAFRSEDSGPCSQVRSRSMISM